MQSSRHLCPELPQTILHSHIVDFAAALESWHKPSEWTPRTEHDKFDLRDEVRQKLEAENTAEAIATGVLISLLCRAHIDYTE